jgi:TPR repeat protein
MPADRERAVIWYKRAAEQGYAPAMFNLACCYSGGIGVAQDKERAVYYLKKAAAAGDLDAMNNLAS